MKACTTKIAVLACYTDDVKLIDRITVASDLPLTLERAIEIVTGKGYTVLDNTHGGCCEETHDDEIAITVVPTAS
jgi:hypothetical protein